MKNYTELKSQEAARASIYLCLAELFRIPTLNFVKLVRSMEAQLAALSSAALGTASRLFRHTQAAMEIEVLKVDYTRLFVGPFLAPAPPYGSIYLEKKRRLMGHTTLDAHEHYQMLGLALNADFKEPPDHIVAELEYMHVLVDRSKAALDSEDIRQLIENLLNQRQFLETHLGAWAPEFASKMMENAQTRFYYHLGSTLKAFMAEELQTMPAWDTIKAAETAVET